MVGQNVLPPFIVQRVSSIRFSPHRGSFSRHALEHQHFVSQNSHVNENYVSSEIDAWLPAFSLPTGDLTGLQVSVAKFHDEDTCRFFFPERTVEFHQQVVDALIPILWSKGGEVITLSPTIEDYMQWSDLNGFEDTPEARTHFGTCVPPVPQPDLEPLGDDTFPVHGVE